MSTAVTAVWAARLVELLCVWHVECHARCVGRACARSVLNRSKTCLLLDVSETCLLLDESEMSRDVLALWHVRETCLLSDVSDMCSDSAVSEIFH